MIQIFSRSGKRLASAFNHSKNVTNIENDIAYEPEMTLDNIYNSEKKERLTFTMECSDSISKASSNKGLRSTAKTEASCSPSGENVQLFSPTRESMDNLSVNIELMSPTAKVTKGKKKSNLKSSSAADSNWRFGTLQTTDKKPKRYLTTSKKEHYKEILDSEIKNGTTALAALQKSANSAHIFSLSKAQKKDVQVISKEKRRPSRTSKNNLANAQTITSPSRQSVNSVQSQSRNSRISRSDSPSRNEATSQSPAKVTLLSYFGNMFHSHANIETEDVVNSSPPLAVISKFEIDEVEKKDKKKGFRYLKNDTNRAPSECSELSDTPKEDKLNHMFSLPKTTNWKQDEDIKKSRVTRSLAMRDSLGSMESGTRDSSFESPSGSPVRVTNAYSHALSPQSREYQNAIMSPEKRPNQSSNNTPAQSPVHREKKTILGILLGGHKHTNIESDGPIEFSSPKASPSKDSSQDATTMVSSPTVASGEKKSFKKFAAY